MAGGGLALAGVVAFLLLAGGKKKAKRKPVELPDDGCGPYPWLPDEIDDVAEVLIVQDGMADVEEISLLVAREVYPITPQGARILWQIDSLDSDTQCLYDRIVIRVTVLLDELEQEADDGLTRIPAPCPPGQVYDPDLRECVPKSGGGGVILTPAACPEGSQWDAAAGECVPIWEPEEPLLCPPGTTPDPQTGECIPDYPDYPPPAPFDVTRYEHHSNYPQPGTFHQIGGENSDTTLKDIAIKALAQFGVLIGLDPQEAIAQARKSANWKAYRTILNCVPTNHAYFASAGSPGDLGYYPTPNGFHIALHPRHDDVRQAMIDGRVPHRYVDPDDPRLGSTRKHAWIWMPPLDPVAYLDGRVEVAREYWDTGDWVLMPPPEFTTWAIHEGIPGLPGGMAWTTLGCEEYETWEAA